MTNTDLRKRVRQKPFVPFRLIVSDGSNFEIRHPEQLMIARDSVVVGIESPASKDNGAPTDGDSFFETTVLVDLFHVTRLEPLSSPSKTASA